MGVSRTLRIKCIAAGVVLGGATCIHALALADPGGRSSAGKRQAVEQLIDCVKKRVATRTVSYRDAIRACRDATKEDGGAATSLIASDARAKPSQER